MKRTIIATALAAAFALPALAQQNSQLVQNLQNELSAEGIHDVDLSQASVGELARIKWILDDTDTTVDQEARVLAVIR